jgi:hypothetical protein
VRRLALLLCSAAACHSSAPVGPLHVRVGVVGRLTTLQPGGSQSSASVLAQDWVFEQLLRVTDAGNLAPGLASSFERLPDGGYRLRLREGARFSDGSPVTDAEVFAALSSPDLVSRREGAWLLVEPKRRGGRIEVQLVQASVAKATAQGAVGTGAFALVEHDERRMLLRRVGPTPAGRITSVELRSFDSPADAFAHTLAGDADVLPEVPVRMVEFFEGVPRLRIARGPGPHAVAVQFDPRTVDLETRKALRAALPHSSLRQIAEQEGCSPLPAGEAAPPPIPDGPPLRVITLREDAVTRSLALGLRRFLGTRAGPGGVADAKAMMRAISAGETQLVVRRFLLAPRTILAAYFQTGADGNLIGYSDPAADAAFAGDDMSAAEAALAVNPPAVYLCIPERIAVVDARFTNARVGPYGTLETLPDWQVGP